LLRSKLEVDIKICKARLLETIFNASRELAVYLLLNSGSEY